MSHPEQDLPGMTTYSDEISMGSGNGSIGVPVRILKAAAVEHECCSLSSAADVWEARVTQQHRLLLQTLSGSHAAVPLT